MPDWSYQTLFRPVLLRLPARLARSLTLRSIGTVSRIPGGSLLIKTLGHIELSPLLQTRCDTLVLDTPVGLSGTVDPKGIAHKAVSQFGFGFIEIGPVTVEPVHSIEPITLNVEKEYLILPDYYENEGLERLASRIGSPNHKLPQLARICPMPVADRDQALKQLRTMLERLSAAGAAGFYIDCLASGRSLEAAEQILIEVPKLVRTLNINDKPIFIYIPLDYSNDKLSRLLNKLPLEEWSGVVVGESSAADSHLASAVKIGREGKSLCIDKIKEIRTAISHARFVNERFVIKAAAGVHEPQDAIDIIAEGADIILLHSGFVFAGPGLPKRINDLLIYNKVKAEDAPEQPSFWKHWGWMCLLGIGMIIGGILSWLVAATTVLLPYDTAFLGIGTADIEAISPHLLHFMSHDRITLAGTMISIGIIYLITGRFALRYGLHWAKTALMTSGIIGFSSFFLYLGFGYFDPLHATVSALLLPLFVLSMRSNPDQPYRKPVNQYNDRHWRLAMWGQLCFVAVGFALAVGGLTIAGVGVTKVFVQSDLDFLHLTPHDLNELNTRLIPMIAHDRAGFGGALLSDAVAILIISLWGIQQGERWLWWMLLLAGIPGFYGALSVHVHIGYTDFLHLSPVFIALLLYIAGLIALYPYLSKKVSIRG